METNSSPPGKAGAIIIDQKRLGGNSRSTLGTITDINPLVRLLFSRIGSPIIGAAHCYSFNDKSGMCPNCQGIGKKITLDINKALDQDKSLNEGAILLPGYKVGTYLWKGYATTGYFDCDKKIKEYSEDEFDKLVYAKAESIKSTIIEGMNTTYEGLVEKFMRQNFKQENEKSEAAKLKASKFTIEETCAVCNGLRYNNAVLQTKVRGYNIAEFTALQIDELINEVKQITDDSVAPIEKNLLESLTHLVEIGLDYITLDRETSTLSGGESQRVKMVKHLTSSLTDVVYIFDEPSIGLHPRDVHRLNELLVKLRDKGNTVLVVEHDPGIFRLSKML